MKLGLFYDGHVVVWLVARLVCTCTVEVLNQLYLPGPVTLWGLADRTGVRSAFQSTSNFNRNELALKIFNRLSFAIYRDVSSRYLDTGGDRWL